MRRLEARVYDDLDAVTGVMTQADQTTTLGLDGIWHELDLTARHRAALEELLADWIKAAHKPAGPVKPPTRAALSGRDRSESYAHHKAMREFADKSKGRYTYHTVRSSNGRASTYKYPQELRDAYAAHLAREATGR